ncbi:hypothetical protein TDB9533_01819 [Thalassocella blandensis]|nr:hypothetical protein TDB9533_01819 [Thalassocella blandensis]
MRKPYLIQLIRTLFVTSLLLATSACSKNTAQPITIYFSAAEKSSANPASFTLRQFKFYLHNVFLIDKQGKFIPARLNDSPPWQQSTGALIKLDQQGEQSNSQITVQPETSVSPDEIAGIQFTLGLDFSTNHQNPLTAVSPFNVGSMYWSWQLGYKFMRLDFSLEDRHFNFHLGSTGCQSASPMRPPTDHCERPNLSTIQLLDFNPTTQHIQLDLSALLKLIPADTPNTHCTGNYQDNPVCAGFVTQLGLSATTGQCIDQCQQQSFFNVNTASAPQ